MRSFPPQSGILKRLSIVAIAAVIAVSAFVELNSAPQVSAAGANLIANPSVETASSTSSIPQGWNKSKSGIIVTQFVYPAAAQDGNRGLRINTVSLLLGEAQWFFNDVPVTGGKSYTFSNYYRSSVVTTLKIRYKLSNGQNSTVTASTVPAASAWTKKEITFTAPANAVSATVMHSIAIVGYLETDNFSFVENGGSSSSSSVPSSSSSSSSVPSSSSSSVPSSSSSSSSVPSEPNLIPNPSFENGNVGEDPTGWHRGGFGNNTAIHTYPSDAYEGARGAKVEMTQFTDGAANWYFDDVSIVAGEIYQYSSYYKSSISSLVEVRYTMSNGSFVYFDIGTAPASSNWTQFTGTFTPPTGAVSVTVFQLIQQVGSLTIDKVRLIPIINAGPGPDSFDKGYVTLTFDDGLVSHYSTVRPMLNTAKLKATFFDITSYTLNTPIINLFGPLPTYINRLQVLQLQSDGHEVGSHTRTHPYLTQLSSQAAQGELQGAKTDLANMGIQPSESFCYPYGDYNDSVIQLVKNAGYKSARTVDTGYNTKTSDKYRLKTQVVENTTSAATIKKWIDIAANNKTWLILTFHQVDNSNSQYGTTPAILQEVVNYLKQKNMAVITQAQGTVKIP